MKILVRTNDFQAIELTVKRGTADTKKLGSGGNIAI